MHLVLLRHQGCWKQHREPAGPKQGPETQWTLLDYKYCGAATTSDPLSHNIRIRKKCIRFTVDSSTDENHVCFVNCCCRINHPESMQHGEFFMYYWLLSSLSQGFGSFGYDYTNVFLGHCFGIHCLHSNFLVEICIWKINTSSNIKIFVTNAVLNITGQVSLMYCYAEYTQVGVTSLQGFFSLQGHTLPKRPDSTFTWLLLLPRSSKFMGT